MQIGKEMTKYSKNRLMSNIDFLLKRKGVKIGELESFVNVSTGYFSRIRNSENDETCPNIDVLAMTSVKLDCSLVGLLYSDYAALSDTELFVIDSINNIIKKTTRESISWERKSPDMFYSSRFPLCKKIKNILNLESNVFFSNFLEKNVSLAGDVLSFTNFDGTFYLVPIVDDSSDTQYEFYLQTISGQIKNILNGNSESKEGVLELLETLYNAGLLSSKKLRLDKDVENALMSFINDDDEEDGE